MNLPAHIIEAKIDLTEHIPLHVYLVKGEHYAVWIDSGVKDMFPLFVETMQKADVAPENLRFILHTHSHHDHIGCNGQLKAHTGCLIAAHPHYANWHSDFEEHYHEFSRPFPHLIPDTPELRAEVLDILDEPAPLDLQIDEGTVFNLGGGVTLEAYSFPGHLLAELGWFEASSRTLILGDAITGLDWELFHSHLTVQGYRDSIDKIARLLDELNVEQVLFAHFPPMTPDETRELVKKAHQYIDDVESTLIRYCASQDTVTLAGAWETLCNRMERLQEFRSLNMVYAHIQDLIERGILREVDTETYQIR